jgi:hypothetical protein
MMPPINEKLLRAKERVQAKRKLEAMLAETQRQVQEQQQRCFKSKQLLDRERAHVERLGRGSLMSRFFTILGTKSERLEKENPNQNQDQDQDQKYLSAKLEHAEAVEAVKFAQMEFGRLAQRLIEFRDADSEHARLVEEKYVLLVEARDQRAETLGDQVQRLADLGVQSLELQEAMQSGVAAVESLERARAELLSAEDEWTWDELGGAYKATQAQLTRVAAASQYAQAAQRLLRKFQEHLADASLRVHVAVHIDGFSTVAKSFFDGPISDWVVKSKIQAASSACGTRKASHSPQTR